MRNLKLGFSLTGCALIMVTFIGINLLTSPSFPWSIFPVFVALWWPISVYAYQKKSAMTMAFLGGGISIIFFIALNLITSPGFPWSIFPMFAVLWWPIGIYLSGKQSAIQVSAAMSLLTAAFLIIVNLITSAEFPWSFFPVFALAWWPLSVYCVKKKNMKLLSVVGAFLMIAFFFTTDVITTPSIEWAFYAAFPILIWPALMVLGKYVKIETILLSSGFVFSGLYILLNMLISPSYPWSVFVAYGFLIIMIPGSFWYRNQGKWAIISSIVISAAFAAAVVIIIGIYDNWMFEIAGIVLVVQACIHLLLKRKYRAAAILFSVGVLLYTAYNNFIETPGHLWFLYAVFPAVWPLVMILFSSQIKTFKFAAFSASTGILYYGILNIFLSPGHPWVIYPAFLILWWPLAAYFARTRNSLMFASLGSLLTIIFLAGINLITSPSVVWFVFPTFALLWWPLSIFFINKKRKVIAEEEHELHGELTR